MFAARRGDTLFGREPVRLFWYFVYSGRSRPSPTSVYYAKRTCFSFAAMLRDTHFWKGACIHFHAESVVLILPLFDRPKSGGKKPFLRRRKGLAFEVTRPLQRRYHHPDETAPGRFSSVKIALVEVLK